MSEREQIKELLDRVPDYDLRSILVLVKGLAVSEEDYVESALDQADYEAAHTSERLTHEEVFGGIRRRIDARTVST